LADALIRTGKSAMALRTILGLALAPIAFAIASTAIFFIAMPFSGVLAIGSVLSDL
jgi:hypothetical protein